ncbi:MAG: DUF2141 domain-containing protein [Lewinellaceae bacterium]|nr:DUF2141 domain-containing protein [Lewinellaceae bacterium]
MILSLLLSTLLLAVSEPAEKGTLQLEIANIRDTRGMIRVGLFHREEHFPDPDKVYWGKGVPPQKGTVRMEIPGLPYGDYALAIYHDLNNNGRLDKNIWGIPTEPYGFSGNVKAKWSSPSFREAAFPFSSDAQMLQISLLNWEEW